MSDRRKRLHDLLLTLINKDNEFKFIEEDSNDLTSTSSEKDTLNLSRVIEKNRKIIKRYQALVRTAVTLDALMDSENEENSNDLTSSYSKEDTLNLSQVIEKNRKIIKRYQAIVRTAVTLDALMDSENEENYKIK